MAKKNIEHYNDMVEKARQALRKAEQERDEMIKERHAELGNLVVKFSKSIGENKNVEELIVIWKNKISSTKIRPELDNNQHQNN
ncbi:hypothetical protein [Streptococcus suis]|uniref:hypothetical protein n=1 Tax=Streptococcus suis TaxID=1307 RepID=UPI0038B9FBB4